jgi:hypothetical protein
MDAKQAKIDANLKEIKASQELLREKRMARLQAKLDANHERMMTIVDSHLEKMDTCLGKMEAMDLEAYP